jgi:hypothetical protein
MRNEFSLPMVAFVMLLGVPQAPSAFAQGPTPVLVAQSAGPVYKPPIRGAPQGRIGGATRGAAGDLPKLEVLAPDHVGWSAVDQPKLYWFLSRDVSEPMQITISMDTEPKPVLEFELPKPVKAGIHSIDLASHGVRLKPLVEYDWAVTIVIDPKQRSSDMLASGSIKFVPPAGDVGQRLRTAAGDSTASAYAEAGYWYDSIQALSQDIDKGGGNRAARASLLDQVGLRDAAAFDRRSP